MTSDMKQTKAEIRAEFEMVLDFVTGEQARTATADQIERGLFTILLSLGAQLLLLFFQMRSQSCSRDEITLENGQVLPYHSEQKRAYFSIFGIIPLWRPYFYAAGRGGQTPLDAELSLGSDRYSDLLREIVEYLAVYVPSYGKAMAIVERILHFKVSTRVVQKVVDEDADDVEAYYEQKPPPDPAEEAEILVIQADGKGVPMVLEEATALAKGWPIASGVIEGACRHFVKDRFELSGMRWTQEGAEQLLRLRAVAENEDWDAYRRYRLHQRHDRLYTSPFPARDWLEFQSEARTGSAGYVRPRHKNTRRCATRPGRVRAELRTAGLAAGVAHRWQSRHPVRRGWPQPQLSRHISPASISGQRYSANDEAHAHSPP